MNTATGTAFVNCPGPVDGNAKISKDLRFSGGFPASHIGSAKIYAGASKVIGKSNVRCRLGNTVKPLEVFRGKLLQGCKPVCAAPGHKMVVQAAALVLPSAVLAPACLEPGLVLGSHGALQRMPDIPVLVGKALRTVSPHKGCNFLPHWIVVCLCKGKEFRDEKVSVVIQGGMLRSHYGSSGRTPVVN